MGKILKLFGIGSAIFVISISLLFSGVLDPGTDMILILPGAIGLLMMLLGTHYGIRRFDRRMNSD